MSERLRTFATIGVMVLMAAAIVALVMSSPTPGDRVARLGSTIMCPVCQGESIAQSPAPMARDMMDYIEERVGSGATDRQITQELLSSFTGAVLLDPPVTGPTTILWIAPAVALLLGLGVIWWWRRGRDDATEAATPKRGRTAATAFALLLLLAGIVVTAGFFLQERNDGAAGVADVPIDNLDEVSNETMEAVIASNLENPEIDGMRLALAERYFTAGDYRSAFPHYLAVAESQIASGDQVVTALVGLGWMAWEGNGETETALGLFDQALAIDAESVSARYLKGRVLWCGAGEQAEATELLTSVLDDDDLSAESREQIETDLNALGNGEPCE